MWDYTDPFAPLFATSTGGDGASALTDAEVLLAQHQRKVRALAHGETGLRFESLVLFAQPLFELYDLDASEAFALQSAPGAADEATVAVLEAARVLWAFFALDEAARESHRDALAAFLLGPNADEDDQDDLDGLLSAIETHWEALTPEDHTLAAHNEHAFLDFDALLAHPAFADAAPATERTYGSEGLGEMEARALFAQPLLERLDDPDDLDATMERADEYWMIAQLHGAERETYLAEFLDAFALSADEAVQLRAEAEEMTERFRSLFADEV